MLTPRCQLERYTRELTAGVSHPGENLLDLKFDVLRSVCDYEHYIPLNLPTRAVLAENLMKVLDECGKKHFLAAWVLRSVSSVLGNHEKNIRTKVRERVRVSVFGSFRYWCTYTNLAH